MGLGQEWLDDNAFEIQEAMAAQERLNERLNDWLSSGIWKGKDRDYKIWLMTDNHINNICRMFGYDDNDRARIETKRREFREKNK